MENQGLRLLTASLTILIVAYVSIAIKLLYDIIHENRWVKSLKKPQLLELEEQLDNCLQEAQIDLEDHSSVDSIIEQQGYSIQEKRFMLLREAYTAKHPAQEVCIRRSLPSSRRHFALAHELMHIIYRQEELDTQPLGRDRHLLFRVRDESEQIRDYMAAGLILPKDVFWNELEDVNYFDMSPRDRKNFVYATARKYDVEPSMVFRRIDELSVIMR